MEIIENRASVILCNFLKSNKFDKPFLLPSNVCPTVPLTFLRAKVDFEFVDIDLSTHTIDTKEVLLKLRTKAYDGLLFVHSYGKLFYNKQLYNDVKKIDNNIVIIDDRCLCNPEYLNIDSNADLTLYSTGYSKYVDLGYGGFAYLNEKFNYESFQWIYNKESEDEINKIVKDALIERQIIKETSFEWFGSEKIDIHRYKTEISEGVKKIKDHKSLINNIYLNSLPKDICWDQNYQNWRFIISIPINLRDKILDAIFDSNLFAGTNYPSVSYIFKGYVSMNAEKEAKSLINLFNDLRVDGCYAEKICSIINKSIKSYAI